MNGYSLKVVSALAIDGIIHRAGSVIHGVRASTACDLLSRGKVELATADDVAADNEALEIEIEAETVAAPDKGAAAKKAPRGRNV